MRRELRCGIIASSPLSDRASRSFAPPLPTVFIPALPPARTDPVRRNATLPVAWLSLPSSSLQSSASLIITPQGNQHLSTWHEQGRR
jgi:hypothetical protein